MIKFFNTLTRNKEELKDSEKPISIYSCGPTVYDFPHIGNWYSFLRWDTLNRTLKSSGLNTNWIMNITDVGHLVSDADDGEDKLEKGAKRENKTAWEVAQTYSDYFIDGLKKLNFSEIEMLPKATDHIDEQINLIKSLDDKGFTYVIDDGVYFDTSKVPDYGKLAHLDIENLKAGARVEMNPQKKNPTDFALWKFSPKKSTGHKRDMEWDSPWGIGFPGWHIECSAMSMKYLGETIDIHTGGIDHIPVHHTNEIAQSESATGKQFVKIWLHSNFLKIDGKKISKSLGNLVKLEDINERGFNFEDFRIHVLSSHYSTEAQFSWESLAASKSRLSNYYAAVDLRWQTNESADGKVFDFKKLFDLVLAQAQDDLNTPELLAKLDEIFSEIIDSNGVTVNQAEDYTDFIKKIDNLTGLNLSSRQDITNEQKESLLNRQTARESNDWAKSDKIRDELLKDKISIRDTSAGQRWQKI